MKSLQLNRAVILETPEQVPDAAGGAAQTWTPLGQIWTQITARGGRESGGVTQNRVKVVTRAAPQGDPRRPRPGQRFRDGSRLLVIESVGALDPNERYLQCLATEEVAV